MNNFKKLNVWNKAVILATYIYKSDKYFPAYERFGLTTQITRRTVSTGSNIAEGAGRGSWKVFRYFFRYRYRLFL